MSVARRGRLSEADPVNCWLAASFRIWGGCGSALPALQMLMLSAAIALTNRRCRRARRLRICYILCCFRLILLL